MGAVDIYSYLDYRNYCSDFYNSNKKSDPKFSYRVFAKKAEVAPSYLKHVIDGRRNISPKMSLKFAKGMGLQQKEIDYFENLVRFSQAISLEEKALYFERLRRKRAKEIKSLGLAEAVDLLSHWYVVAIKEIVVNLNSDDVRLIQRCVRKKLPENLIQKTIDNLKELGWLRFEDGRWLSSNSQVQFPDEVKSYIVRSFHRQMLELATEALGDEIEDREFGAAMFTFPASRLPELKERIKEMQKDLIGYVQDVASSTEDRSEHLVYHFGVQCFALQDKTGIEALEKEND
jgi:uncharacterized protein (TIGR02147 family)